MRRVEEAQLEQEERHYCVTCHACHACHSSWDTLSVRCERWFVPGSWDSKWVFCGLWVRKEDEGLGMRAWVGPEGNW